MTKEYKAYKKMHKQHKKDLKKLIKVDAEWDWYFLHDLVIAKIRHMHEYYVAGNNVWQTDETRLPTIEQLKHVLDLQDELDNLFSNPELIRPVVTKKDNGSLEFSWTEEAKAISDAAYKREDEIYKEMYAYIGEHLREWWD